MNLKAIVFIMALLPFFAFSQFATMTQSEPIKALNGRTHKISMYLDKNDNIILHQYSPKFLVGYNVNYNGNINDGSLSLCQMKTNKEFVSYQIHKYSKTDFELNQTFKFGSNIVALLEMYDKSTDTYHLAYSLIEGSNIKSQEPQKLCSFPIEKKRQINVTVIVSEDKKHFALINEVSERNENPVINCAVFDENFKQVWKRTSFEIKSRYPLYSIENMILGNDKTIYLYFETYLREKRMIVQFESSMISFNEENTEKEVVKFNNFLPAHSKVYQQGKKIMLIGNYLLTGKDGIQGMYTATYNPKNKSFEDIFQSKFSQTLINEANFQTVPKKKKPLSINNLEIKNVLPQSDGSLIVLSEDAEIEMVVTYDSRGGSKTEYFYYNYCIFLSRISKDGEIEWTKLIPKSQVSKNTSGSVNSFAVHQNENGIYLFYNDHEKNLAAGLDDIKSIRYSSKGNNIYCVMIDPSTGKYSKQHLLGKENKKLWFFHEVLALSPNKVAFIAIKGSKKHLCIVDLK